MSDTAAVTAALARDDGWQVEQHVGYDGLVTLVATNDLNGLSFAFARSEDGLQVTEVRDDVVAPRGTFPDVNSALDVVVRTKPKA